MDTTCVTSPLPVADRLWFFEIVIGILVLVALNFLIRRIIRHVRQRSLSVHPDWRKKIDQIFFLPFQILLWILGVTLVIEVLGRRFDFSFFDSYIDAFRSTGFVLCVAWVLLRWKSVVLKEFLNKDRPARKVDAGFMIAVGRIISIVIIVLSLMIILQVWGLNIAPLIAFGGIGAAAVGFAGKDVLANFFGGLMIHINRPFMVGDLIQLPDRQLEGNVEEIGWNLTTMRDKDKRPIYLPNSTFSNTYVINMARRTHRRIEEKIGIRYEDFEKIPVLVGELKNVISHHGDIDTHMPIIVVFNGFGQCTLDMHLEFFTLQTRQDKYMQVRHEVLMLVYAELKKAGAEMPTPMVSVTGRLITS